MNIINILLLLVLNSIIAEIFHYSYKKYAILKLRRYNFQLKGQNKRFGTKFSEYELKDIYKKNTPRVLFLSLGIGFVVALVSANSDSIRDLIYYNSLYSALIFFVYANAGFLIEKFKRLKKLTDMIRKKNKEDK